MKALSIRLGSAFLIHERSFVGAQEACSEEGAKWRFSAILKKIKNEAHHIPCGLATLGGLDGPQKN